MINKYLTARFGCAVDIYSFVKWDTKLVIKDTNSSYIDCGVFFKLEFCFLLLLRTVGLTEYREMGKNRLPTEEVVFFFLC